MNESVSKALPATAAPKEGARIDYELFLDCVHCGLCLSACPTFLELGTEMDSPRGRIYLMRAVTDGRATLNNDLRRHLDLCLDCRACESACPSGVNYGKLIEPFRVFMNQSQQEATNLSWLQRLLVFHLFPRSKLTRFALTPVQLLQRCGLDSLLERTVLSVLPKRWRQFHQMLPRLEPHYGRLPEILPAQGPRRARVALFTGCVADAIFPQTTISTARVLQLNGCEVWVPRTQACCGALYYHSGREEPARALAARNCGAFGFGSAGVEPPVDAVIVNAAGCGAMLKDYGHLLHGTAHGERFAARVRDICEFLMELGPIQPRHPVRLRATYHDACHLCHAQQIRQQPRQLLEMIPELKLTPLHESEVCCGAAGTYNLSEPEMAEQLGARKAANIQSTKPEAVFTGNVGCLLQIGRHLRARGLTPWLAHPVDALWASYSGRLPDGVIGRVGPSA
jgi:glycolate oxidase iron-sulfur subunit